MWVATLLRLIDPSTGVAYQTACIAEIYMVSPNSSKISYEEATNIMLELGMTTHEELY